MSKVYLLVYSNLAGSREQVKKAINDSGIIRTWRYDMPNSFYLVSESSAEKITDALHRQLGKRARFIVSEITENRQGWLPKDTWYFIREKRPRRNETG